MTIKCCWNKIFSVISLCFSTILIILLGLLNLMPIKIYLPILLVIMILNIVNLFLSFKIKLNKKIQIIQIILSAIMTLISIIGSFYLSKTILFINNLSDNGIVTQNYSVVVLKNATYEQLNDLADKNISIFKNDLKKSKVIDYLNGNINGKLIEVSDLLTFKESLYKEQVDAIVIEDSYKALIEEIDSEFMSKTKVIHTFSFQFESEDISKNVDVTKEPFAVYVSGIDTYGNISSVSRSDVNIVAVVNPKTYQVLLISIPRDYYVRLHGTTGYKDKLTHAGMYGVEMSVQTIEDLLGLTINYYFKVNFTSLIDIIDALGGVDVYSEYSFDSEVGYYFYKGYNSVNGTQALAFARARHAFIDGDRQRGKNQQAVIEAVIRKAASKAIITKFDSLLDAVTGKFQTNLEIGEITDLAKLQLDKMPSWTVKSISLNGFDSSNYTYTYSSGELYVMEPDQKSIDSAKEIISQVLSGQKIESSYGEVSNIKNPGIIESTPDQSNDGSDVIEDDIDFSLNISDVTVQVGENTQLIINNPKEDIVSWNSSNPSVATVSSDGLVTPISDGITTITASISGKTASCIIRVTNPLNIILPEDNEQENADIDDSNSDTTLGEDISQDVDYEEKQEENE